MIEDEMQVLGTKHKGKTYWKWGIVIAGLLSLLVLYHFASKIRGEVLPVAQEQTTISSNLQNIVDTLLNEKMAEFDCLQGQAIVMEVQTGAIRAMVGLERDFEGCYHSCENFAYQEELGHFAMVASLLAALEMGEVNLSDVVDTGNGVLSIGDGFDMKDNSWLRGGYGELTVGGALEVCSNIGVGKAVVRTFGSNQQAFFDQLNKMSYGQPSEISGIEGLKHTNYSSPKDSHWVKRNIWWSAIGYERKMAPIQMLAFYNAIANGGKMVKPSLKPNQIEVINPQIASKDNLDSIRNTLERVVTHGLCKKAETPLMKVAGLASTSQVNEYYGVSEEAIPEYQMGFCGYFPADNPQYSVVLSMNKIGKPATGAVFVSPVFRSIVEWMSKHGMVMTNDDK